MIAESVSDPVSSVPEQAAHSKLLQSIGLIGVQGAFTFEELIVDQSTAVTVAHGVPVILDDNDSATHAGAYFFYTVPSEAGTLASPGPDVLQDEINRLFAVSEDVVFEDGVETTFSRELSRIVVRYGSLAAECLYALVESAARSTELMAETLRLLARVDSTRTHTYRRRIIEKGLESAAPLVRDAASLALASINDPRSLPALSKAAERESIPELRDELLHLIEQLRS